MNPISNELSKAVRLALTVGAASVAVVPAVYAQDDAETLETITVVGSRIYLGHVPGFPAKQPWQVHGWPSAWQR